MLCPEPGISKANLFLQGGMLVVNPHEKVLTLVPIETRVLQNAFGVNC
jgi:hypothetical protein